MPQRTHSLVSTRARHNGVMSCTQEATTRHAHISPFATHNHGRRAADESSGCIRRWGGMRSDTGRACGSGCRTTESRHAGLNGSDQLTAGPRASWPVSEGIVRGCVLYALPWPLSFFLFLSLSLSLSLSTAAVRFPSSSHDRITEE